MQFEDRWNDLFGQLLAKQELPAETSMPTPDEVAGALREPWMAEGMREFNARANILLQRAEEGGTFSPQLLLSTLAAGSLTGLKTMLATQIDQIDSLLNGNTKPAESKTKGLVILNMKIIHITWEATPEADRAALKHPIAALIEAWLLRPVPATRNTKPTGIIVKDHYHILELTRPTSGDLAEVGVGGQAMLPGLKDLLPDYDEMDIFPVLALFDVLQGSDKEAGLGLRMLVTVLTEIDMKISTPISNSGVLVRMILRELVKHLWPRSKFDRRNMPRLRAAMFGWDHAGVPDRGGLRRVIGTVGEWILLPDDYPLDGEVVFQVYLPPGTRQGALVHRETLDYLGAASGLMYRAALTLAHQWWRATRTKGKGKNGETLGTTWPYAKRPAKLRNDANQLVDRKGVVLLNRSGYPIRNWNDPRTVPDPNCTREPNPMIQYLPTYEDGRILRLCYPASKITPINRHVYLARAWKAVQDMERLGLLEMAYHGGSLKLCPPRGWGVNFQMPAAVKALGTRRRMI